MRIDSAPTALLRLAFLLAIVAPTVGSAQECPVGEQVGTDCGDLAYAGCCEETSTVRWCEEGIVCQLDCSANTITSTHNCCEANDELFGDPGCCDATIQACVCALDPWCCENTWDSLCATYASDNCGGCPNGCPTSMECGWKDDAGFYDCTGNNVAGPDPSGVNPMMCGGGGCVGSCLGKTCGDDGCGGSCGVCPGGTFCDVFGACQSSCTADCTGKNCGDDGCGGSCGTCTGGATCTFTGVCVATCTPSCAGKQCGDDGCGTSCGTCPAGAVCDSANKCATTCTPNCGGVSCGTDGCGGSCGMCGAGELCNDFGQCVDSCTADCTGKSCGDDGCGGTCGACGPAETCKSGVCKTSGACVPDCAGKVCGSDGCQGSCGICQPPLQCEASAGTCFDPTECTPDCAEKSCGADGCGGICGVCGDNELCTQAGACEAQSTDGVDGTTGTSGVDGVNGTTAIDGTSGPDGTAGSDGATSTDGSTATDAQAPTCVAPYVLKFNVCQYDPVLAAGQNGVIDDGVSGADDSGCQTSPTAPGTPWFALAFAVLLAAARLRFRRTARQTAIESRC